MRTFASTALMIVLAGGLAFGAGCAKRGKGLSKVDKEALKEHILDDMPGDVTNKVDVNFEDKIHLIGWKAVPETAAPGSTVRITIYWKKTGDLDPGWKLFTHVTTDNVKEAKGNLDCVGLIRSAKVEPCAVQLYGPSDWEKGKVIVDTFDFAVPNEVTWPTYRFLVGIWKDDARLHIKNADASDGDNRANVIALPTGVKAPEPPPPPKTEVPKLNAPKFGKNEIKIDGKLDEPAWGKAGLTGPFVAPGDGKTPPDHPVNGSAKVGWDDTNLYVAFTVDDRDPTATFKSTDKDPRIWSKDSAVELMIQPGDTGDNKEYYEIQVNTVGAVFDTAWDDYNQPITGNDEATKVFGHMDWSSGLKAGTMIEKGKSYTIEVAVPWASFKKPSKEGVNIPPKPGDVWRVNFYSFRDAQNQALGWSPILGQGNFHKSARFGQITFGDKASGAAPSASASGSASVVAPPGLKAPTPAGAPK